MEKALSRKGFSRPLTSPLARRDRKGIGRDVAWTKRVRKEIFKTGPMFQLSLSLSLSGRSARVRSPLNFQWAEDSTISGRRSRGLNSGNKFANKLAGKFVTPRERRREFRRDGEPAAISPRYSLGWNLPNLRERRGTTISLYFSQRSLTLDFRLMTRAVGEKVAKR